MNDIHRLSDDMLLHEIKRRFDEKNSSLLEMEFLNKKLLELNQRLSEMDSSKSQFLSLIKNEFNNPISSILNICSILISNKKPERSSEFTQMLHREALGLDFQIKNIIAASEIEAGKAESYITKIDFESIHNEVKNIFEYLITEKSLNVIFKNETDTDVFSDGAKIYLILLNILSNACEHSYQNGNITILVKNDNDNLYIEVADDGEGIVVDNKLLVYNRFTQFNVGSNRPKNGLGLGLSVVKGEVESMDGIVDYESTQGNTTFFVKIPLIKECGKGCGIGGANDILFEDFGDAVEL
jgi:signal transduction histidine kinase